MKLNLCKLIKEQMHLLVLDRQTKSYLTVLGTSLIYFAMGLYFAAGNTGVYLTSYLIYRANSDMKLDDAIWFLSAAGFSALLLPIGGWLESKVGVRAVCLIGGLLQSAGIFSTYYALDTTFLIVVIVYGGSFLVSLASCYTSPLVNVCKWHPKHKGLVSGIGAASMAVAPTLFTPLITSIVNPTNLPANDLGLFDDAQVLDRTKYSILVQGFITLTLFLVGVTITFPAPNLEDPEHDLHDEECGENKFYNKPSEIEWICNGQPVALTKYVRWESYKPTEDNYMKKNLDVEIQIKDEENYIKKLDQTDAIVREIVDCSIEPKYAFKTSEFWLLSLKVLISELIFIYLLFMYKPYGQTFIQDDYFLSAVGAACAISNTVGRLSMGHFKDKFGYKAVSIPLSAITMVFISIMPLTKYFNKLFYGCAVVLAVGGVGSQYALMPSAAQDSFGDKYAGINIGFVYMSTVIATVSSALLSQHLTSLVGWEGMIYLIASCSAIDFMSTFFMPNDPSKRLLQRYKQFYASDNKSKVINTRCMIAAA